MIADQSPLEVEGTWEDVLCRGSEFAGRRVRVTVLAQEASPPGRSLDQVLAPLIEQARNLQRAPNPPGLKGLSAEFSGSVAEELRKQGLKT